MAVVGHVEWVQFARVGRVPAQGEIVHATDSWEEPGGAGAVAAVQLARLGGWAALFTALGDDRFGHAARDRLSDLGVTVHAVFRPIAQRRAFCFLDDQGERTIATTGERMGPAGSDALPWAELDRVQGAYFVAGDVPALRMARRARALVATSRVMSQLAEARVPLDAVVGSDRDPAERYIPLEPPPRLVVATRGAEGGVYRVDGGAEQRFAPAPVPGPVVDTYGCGDSFAGGVTYGLGIGLDIPSTLALAARCGAACLTGAGPYGAQLTLGEPSAR